MGKTGYRGDLAPEGRSDPNDPRALLRASRAVDQIIAMRQWHTRRTSGTWGVAGYITTTEVCT